jgi:hypothetical protein
MTDGHGHQCVIKIGHVVIAVRVLSLVAHGTLGAAGAWGFLLANRYFNPPPEQAAAQERAAAACASWNVSGISPTNIGLFTGLMAVYFSLFGILGILAEIRGEWLTRTVLRPFGFLTA